MNDDAQAQQLLELAKKYYNEAIASMGDKRDFGKSMKQLDSSIKKFRKFIENKDEKKYGKDIKLDLAKALNARGCAYYERKKYKSAIEDYTEAIDYNKKFGLAYHNSAKAYRKLCGQDVQQPVQIEESPSDLDTNTIYKNQTESIDELYELFTNLQGQIKMLGKKVGILSGAIGIFIFISIGFILWIRDVFSVI